MGVATPAHIARPSACEATRGGECLAVGALSSRVSPDSVPDWSRRIPALDGLRGVAILMVLMRHSVFGYRPSSRLLLGILSVGKLTWSGVDLFFVLSGFLIGGILLDARNSTRYFKTFYMRRAYRILPLYYLVTGLVFFIYLPLHLIPGPLAAHSRSAIPWAAYLTFTQNWVWSRGIPVLGATWSLCVEEQFYLTIPLVIRNLTRRWLVAWLVSVVLATPLLRILLYHLLYHCPNGNSFILLTPCRADALCLGVLSAVLVRHSAGWRLLLAERIWLRAALVILFLGMGYLTRLQYTPFKDEINNAFGFSWIALFYTAVLLAVVSANKGIMRDALCNPTLMRLGTLAYCSYLIHTPLQHVGRRLFALALGASPNTNWFLGGMLGLVATVIIASFSWTLFEKPLLKMGHKYSY